MKKAKLVVFFLLAVVVSSCSKKDNVPDIGLELDNTLTVKHNSGNFEVQFLRDLNNPTILDLSQESSEGPLLQMVNRHFQKNTNNFIKLVNFKIDRGGEHSYLIFEGYDSVSKKTSSFAYEIMLTPGGVSASFTNSEVNSSGEPALLGSEVVESGAHKCAGDPCSCCEFTKNSKGTIVGCKCSGVYLSDDCPFTWNQWCNHEVSTENLVPGYGQCGGNGYTGSTSCAIGFDCVYINESYSQCLP